MSVPNLENVRKFKQTRNLPTCRPVAQNLFSEVSLMSSSRLMILLKEYGFELTYSKDLDLRFQYFDRSTWFSGDMMIRGVIWNGPDFFSYYIIKNTIYFTQF